MRRSSLASFWSALAIAAWVVVAPTGARAQRGVDAELFHPSLDSYGIFSTERSETAQPWELGLKLFTNYAANPLRLAISDGMASSMPPAPTPIMSRQIAVDFGVHLGLTRWLELALQVPISAQGYTAAYGAPASAGDMMLANTGFFVADSRSNVPAPDASPLDARVALKARVSRGSGFGLGWSRSHHPVRQRARIPRRLELHLPSAAVADYTRGHFSVAINVGAIVRRPPRSTIRTIKPPWRRRRDCSSRSATS